jgi:hypothetical protein
VTAKGAKGTKEEKKGKGGERGKWIKRNNGGERFRKCFCEYSKIKKEKSLS